MPSSRLGAGVVRSGFLLLCLALALLAPTAEVLLFLAGLAAAAAVATAVPPEDPAARALRTVEAVVWATAVVVTGPSGGALLPYLVAVGFTAGLARGLPGVTLPLAGAVVTVIAGAVVNGPPYSVDAYGTSVAQWLALAVAAGLIGSGARRLQQQAAPTPDEPYQEAYRLVSQLRLVTRELSVGLDPVTQGEALLAQLRAELPYERAAILVRSHGERLVPLAVAGADRVEWRVDLSDDSPFAEAWASQRPQPVSRGLAASRSGPALVLPLVVGVRTIGLVGIEHAPPRIQDSARLARLDALTRAAALRLETGLIFDEVRAVATAEERRRLAREIHDGIAQELTSVGYAVDAAAADVGEGLSAAATADRLRSLRADISRVISELRLSIFDLRSEVDSHGGLGAALSEHVRAVGASSPMRVHLTLDEAALRLPSDVESELLRIAQEAIANARRHAAADNLWVLCQVDPPHARIVVADDGRGLQPGRKDSFGLDIMRERAARLRADLVIRHRDPCGTEVCVELTGRASEATVPSETALPDDDEEVRRADQGAAR